MFEEYPVQVIEDPEPFRLMLFLVSLYALKSRSRGIVPVAGSTVMK
jgi:hypothetical protein